ncbi:MAG TPA: YetF domain-containing protein [Acidimicrobiales bacterium]|nr:YetF domain-containing protein [Acidimicrobiales bacterium]
MEIIVRAAVIYVFVWLIVRGTGKRELAEMTAFELVLLVVMGDLIQQAVTQQDTSIVGGMLAVGTIGFLIVVTSYVTWRFKGTRNVIEGASVVIVRDGKPLEDILRLERVTLDEVLSGARNQGISDLADVQIGVLEADGKFSFLTRDKEQHQPDEKHET